MRKVLRDMARAIRAVTDPEGVKVEGPESTGSGHYKFVLRWRGRSVQIVCSASPRCEEVVILKAKSMARRSCVELKGGVS